MQKDNLQRPYKGLHTDSSKYDQPKDTYTFALNAVNETELGESSFIGNEESNEICTLLKTGYTPIGKVYMTDNEVVIFSVSLDETVSEIGILKDNCTYEVHVNDALSSEEEKLNFRTSNQIDAVYRLRRGCERTIYFTDNLNKPRYFNFDKPEQFKSGGNWDSIKFSLFKVYNQIPVFEDISIEETGTLPPGSYNAAIQYLDEDLNPTEWITTSDTILIYNDNFSKDYSDIRGSTALQTDYQNFGNTNKAIKLRLSNLDRSFPFYRVAIIESNNGSGQVSDVKVSQEISTEILSYTYTGTASAETSITEEEVLAFNSVIQQAESIEQIENRLLLANTKGKQLNFCKLQKYASRIKADLTTKEIILNSLTESNPKNGTVHFDGTGYMPGEMYSFGIVYIFEDNTISPVYHIPGKNNATENQVFSPGENARPMALNNTLTDTFYTDNSSCVNYWGYDSEGELLTNSPVRHHRFPLRSQVGLPLFKEQVGQESINLEQLVLNVTGSIDAGYTEEIISIVVEYEIEGNTSIYETTINTDTFDETNGASVTITTSSNPITILNIYENNVVVNGTSSTTGLSYSNLIEPASLNIDDKIFTSQIYGIKFSGIDLPSEIDTNGQKIIGYYIVRNKRDEDNKSILDTGVLTPMLDETADNGYFVAHGHIFPEVDPESSKVKNDIVSLIHPEHRFSNKEYKQTTKLIREGVYTLKGSQAISSVRTQDVMAGTSYDPETSKRREKDSDGFSLHTLTRDNEVEYLSLQADDFNSSDINEVFYLNALFSKSVEDTNNSRKEVFNTSGDNKIGAISFNSAFNKNEVTGRLPYVIMARDLSNAYGNFRILDYYKEGNNPIRFITDNSGNVVSGSETVVFGGDTYIAPMRYFSSVFYDVRLRKRSRKSGVLRFIISVVAIAAGIVLIATGAGAAAGIAAIGFGISQFAAGLKVEQMNKIYSELYDAGLRNAVNDGLTDKIFGANPPDDEVQWLGESVTNLWFESTANMALRQGTTIGIPDFLNAPAVKANPGDFTQQTFTYPWGGNLSIVNSSDSPQNELDEYFLEKLTVLDSENSNGRLYQGYPNAELYQINKDYRRRNTQKVFFHLGIEYDCCSNCIEQFPHRIHYSEQSFQEELTDNFRTFLPNNYRDIEGETGVITDLFKISNRLFIHTEEALWELPKNYQERVTDQIVSFIGTGSYFEIPPQKLIDDETGSSGGNQHKWSTIKTPHGVFFISENQNKVYNFNGRQLKAISNNGESNWFKENTALKIDEQYYAATGNNYPYKDNPSNPFGAGFLSTYDTKKERVIFSKKDFSLSDSIVSNSDFEVCVQNGNFILFEDFSTIVQNELSNGWTYEGIEDCRLKFEKTEFETVLENRETITTIPNNADIHIFYDTSGSFGSFSGNCLQSIDSAVDEWTTNFANINPDWTGTVYKYQDASERWVNYAQQIAVDTYPGENLATKDIIVVSFCNESASAYHGNSLDNPIANPTATYTQDYNNFITLQSQYNSFVGIHYPIVFGENSGGCGSLSGGSIPASRNFLLHSLAALKGDSFTASEVSQLEVNQAFTAAEWDTLKTSLQGPNPYPQGLENFGWQIKTNRFADSNGQVIDALTFQNDIEELLQGILTTESIQVEVQVPTTVVQYIDGVSIENPIELNNSWTKSFSLKQDMWVGYHSYLPSFYINVPEKFYSWIPGLKDNAIWKHNVKGSYQTYYGQFYPHILEYVSLSNPVQTRIWNHIKLVTEAKQYDTNTNQYVDKRFRTFNKAILYNTRQCSGIMNLVVKDEVNNQSNYLMNQVVNTNDNSFIIDRNERDWTLNDLRDIRIDYNRPIWDSTINSVQSEFYIDKTLNTSTLDVNKDWTQLESFRDKYLAIRLIFDTFADTKLLTNYSVENEQPSFR